MYSLSADLNEADMKSDKFSMSTDEFMNILLIVAKLARM